MIRKITVLCVGVILLFSGAAFADWAVGDGHKMHSPQMPDEAGWDVNATSPLVLGDDWQCSETGWVKDIHFWGSWRHGEEGTITSFIVRIWSDIPADPPTIPYSMPGTLLWEFEALEFPIIPIDPPSMEGWYDPSTGEIIPDDHDAYFQYNIFLPEADWFWQDDGITYWLTISAIIVDPVNTQWGWKSSIDHWNDDAVWAFEGDFDWIDLWEPSEPIYNQFWVALDPSGWLVPAQSGGTDFFGDGWYFYEETEWWNIWFYDHPYDPDRRKIAHIEVDAWPLIDAEAWLVLAVNWSTDQWSIDQPPGDSAPPLPGVDESLYIGRDTIYAGPVDLVGTHIVFDWVFPDYNPEWVSIDVTGFNFIIPEGDGRIWHECQQSLDLSFVITGGVDLGACCFPDGSCDDLVEPDCVAQGGFWQGVGTQCLGDLDGNFIDDACEGLWPLGACCDPADGSQCVNTSQSACQVAGWDYKGDGSACLGDLNGNGLDDACEPLGACCFPDGSCANRNQTDCVNQGGTWQGAGTQCLGDLDGNFIDDACEGLLPVGACCNADGSQCVNTSQTACQAAGWDYKGDGTVCLGDFNGNGIDDACEPLGACCFADGSCRDDLVESGCNSQGGNWQGVGTQCLGDLDGNFIDDACEGLWPLGACCNADGTQCVNTSHAACQANSWNYKGDGTACLGDLNGNGLDDACEGLHGACCYDNGTCDNLVQSDCEATPGAIWRGGGTACQGDNDGNGIDDACEAGWLPGDPHKMHFPQLPDETGWDVNATWPTILADDFRCSEDGPIKDIHFWGSWKDGIEGQITSFILSFHSDLPADQSPSGHSEPLDLLWELEVPFDQVLVSMIDPPTLEGWYDPVTGEVLYDNHQSYFQYNVYLEEQDWFVQEEGVIYWLNISANIAHPWGAQWGWKSTTDHWNDDAVWSGAEPPYTWTDIWEPTQPILNGWGVMFDAQGDFIDGFGEDAFGEGWYFYPSGWWNIWFYDHPFTYDRKKVIHLEFDVTPFDSGPSFLTFAVNWSTDLWSLEQPGDTPPLPGVDELRYIGREILLEGPDLFGHHSFDFEIPDYNPEWVSIDVMGSNFIVEGLITHDCVGSLDLSFVITAGEDCDCMPGDADGNVIYEISDAVWIIAYVFVPGSPAPTPYALCSGDADCNCIVEISDAVWMISYVFVPGSPAPCDCQTWLSICGPPLRK